MLSKTLEDGLNEQLDGELYASHLYLAMSAYCEGENLAGCAHWMRIQADEERAHALGFYRFIFDRGGRAVVGAVASPPVAFDSPLQVFEQALEHERLVSEKISALYGLAAKEEDYATQAFLQAFVSEQVEEEAQASRIVDTLRMIGDDGPALLVLDRELGGRAPAGG